MRLLIAAIALYALASIAVSVVRGRWLRSISTTGIEVDSLSEATLEVSILQERLRRAQAEGDEANRLLEECLRG